MDEIDTIGKISEQDKWPLPKGPRHMRNRPRNSRGRLYLVAEGEKPESKTNQCSIEIQLKAGRSPDWQNHQGYCGQEIGKLEVSPLRGQRYQHPTHEYIDLQQEYRIESERFELPGPFSRRISQSLDPNAAGQTTFDRCFDEVRCEKRERDGHIDLSHAAFLACGDLFNVSGRA
jgi:hypothetical protein